jgi:glycosyltransferase involved in cell wall biosynthesis
MAESARNGRPAALFIAPIMPSDRGNGLAIRTGFLLDTYAKRFAVDLAIVPVAGGATAHMPFAASRVRRAVMLPAGAADTHFALINSVAEPKARLAAFRQYGRPSITARLSGEVERALFGFAGDACYQLVHVSRLYLAGLAAAWMHAGSGPPHLVLDCDEDDVSVYRRFALLHRRSGRTRRALWADAEADAFDALGRQFLSRFHLLLAASAGEGRRLQTRAGAAAIAVIPNIAPGAPIDPARVAPLRGQRDILFVGNMGYLPNIDAATWFANRIWPKLRQTLPLPSRFVIAGDGAPRELMELARRPGIVFAGEFDAAGALYRRAALAIVPIRAGGGTRIKLLEAARYGVPVVATRFGAEGTGFRSGHELLLADTESDFAAACTRLLTDFGLASRLVAGARRKVAVDYNARRSAKRLLDRIDAWFPTE